MTAVGLRDRMLSAEEAVAIASWSYPPPFDFYEVRDADPVALITARDADGYGYYPVQDGPDVVGFVCFGAEARVRGQQVEAGTCDIGMGIEPGWLSHGVGTAVLPEALRFAAERFGAVRARVAVAAFNERSLRLCRSAGFRPVREFAGPDDRPFVELAVDLPRDG